MNTKSDPTDKNTNNHGKFFIINHVDRPDQNHVCQLIEEDKLEYISERLWLWNANNGYPFGMNERVTPMEDFGFDIKVAEGFVAFTHVRESAAEYKNGGKRFWQGATSFTLKMKDKITRKEDTYTEDKWREVVENENTLLGYEEWKELQERR